MDRWMERVSSQEEAVAGRVTTSNLYFRNPLRGPVWRLTQKELRVPGCLRLSPGPQRSGRGKPSTLFLLNPQLRLCLSEMGTFLVEPHRQGIPHRFPGELQSKGDITGGHGVSGRARPGWEAELAARWRMQAWCLSTVELKDPLTGWGL